MIQLGLHKSWLNVAAKKNTADEKRYMFTCYRFIEKLREKRTRMGKLADWGRQYDAKRGHERVGQE